MRPEKLTPERLALGPPKLCGAKTRSGKPCTQTAMPNGRCRMHGGASVAPPHQGLRAFKDGLYGKFFTQDEVEEAGYYPLDNIDHEIHMCRIRLARALSAEMRQRDNPQGALEVATLEVSEGGTYVVGATSDLDRMPAVKTQTKAIDYHVVIDRMLARLESLVKTRATLNELNRQAQLGTDGQGAAGGATVYEARNLLDAD